MRVKEIFAALLSILLIDLVIGHDRALNAYEKLLCNDPRFPQLNKSERSKQSKDKYVVPGDKTK